jgi:hypothetical protein
MQVKDVSSLSTDKYFYHFQITRITWSLRKQRGTNAFTYTIVILCWDETQPVTSMLLQNSLKWVFPVERDVEHRHQASCLPKRWRSGGPLPEVVRNFSPKTWKCWIKFRRQLRCPVWQDVRSMRMSSWFLCVRIGFCCPLYLHWTLPLRLFGSWPHMLRCLVHS